MRLSTGMTVSMNGALKCRPGSVAMSTSSSAKILEKVPPGWKPLRYWTAGLMYRPPLM